MNCANLTEVSIPSTVTVIKWDAFYKTGLQTVNIPGNVESIGTAAFEKCSSLESVVLGNGVKTLKSHVFHDCEKLESVTLSNTLETIGAEAFYKTGLKSMAIPPSVTTIGDGAVGCNSYDSSTHEYVSADGFVIFGDEGSYAETYAADNDITFAHYSGVTGDCTYSFDPATGTMTISGEGAMANGYEDLSNIPWYAYRDQILHVVVEDGVTTVGYLSFIDCANLTDVTLGKDVFIISSAFKDCTSLSEINLPDVLGYISGGAFEICTSLESIEFPTQNQLNLYGSAFSGSGLKSLTVPANVVFKEDQVFMNCNSLTEVTVYSQTLGEKAFAECENLEKATIYSKTIGSNAFYHCEKLTDLTLCEGVETIEKEAFQWCTSLSDVTLPESLRTVYRAAFYNCPLPCVTIPAGVTYIEDLAFGFYIVNLNEFKNESFVVYGSTDVAKNYAEKFGFAYNPTLTGTTGDCTWTFDPETATLTISGSGAMGDYNDVADVPWTLYTKLQGADDPSYHQAHIKNIVIEDGVTRIGKNCFSRTYSLESLDIPSTVTALGESAFNESGIKTVTIPGSIETVSPDSFRNCEQLTTVVLGEGVKYIGDRAFYDCKKLSSVTLPSTLKEVYSEAFFGDTALESVYVPVGVTKIEDAAFGIAFNSDFTYAPIEGFVIYGVDDSTAKTYAQNSGVTFIPLSGTTGDCSWEFNRDNGILHVWGSGAMATYFDVNSVPWHPLSDEIKKVVIDDGVTVIGDMCFCDLDQMESVTLPDTLTGIGAFSGSSAFTTADIPDGVTIIGNYAFDGCASLESMTLPKSVTNIGRMAFRGTGLSGITITNPQTEIGLYALGYGTSGDKTPDFTISGYNNSSAQQYANNHGFTFVSLNKVINSVKITGITAPVADETPDYTATTPENAGYKVDVSYNEDGLTNGIIWHYEDYDMLFSDDTFEAGEKYLVTVRIIADEYHIFPAPANGHTYQAGELPCTINGNAADVEYYSESAIYVTYKFTCESDSYILGDADGDEDVSAIDVTLIQRYCADFNINVPEETLMHGDVDDSGDLDILDATLIQRFLADFNVQYPIGEWV